MTLSKKQLKIPKKVTLNKTTKKIFLNNIY